MFDLLVSEARLVSLLFPFPSLSLSLLVRVAEEEEWFPMVFGIRCHVALADAKLGHLVNSDAHTELSASLDKIRPSYCVIPNIKTIK